MIRNIKDDLEHLTVLIDRTIDDPNKHIEFALVRSVAKYQEFVEELTALEERL